MLAEVVAPRDGELFEDGLSGLRMKVLVPEGGLEGALEGAQIGVTILERVVGGVPEFRGGIGEMVEDATRGGGNSPEIDDPDARDGSRGGTGGGSSSGVSSVKEAIGDRLENRACVFLALLVLFSKLLAKGRCDVSEEVKEPHELVGRLMGDVLEGERRGGTMDEGEEEDAGEELPVFVSDE